MSFPDAVRSVLTQYFQFNGRARRSEYWWWVLAYVVVGVVVSLIDRTVGTGSILQYFFAAAVLLPWIGVSCRRLHDTGRSGLWTLLWLIPVLGWIPLIIFWAGDSQPGSNQYGPSPKEAVAV